MVTLKSVEKQLKRIRFNHASWNHAEAMELPNILLQDEVIYECVNGTYEGGFALLCATNVRMLLIDKKPFKFLTVEDLRFDMINQIDYSHRLFGAQISVSAGSKNLKFMSFNQERLRKLIGHVQHCMAESKKEQSTNAETQQQHLEQINQQLQTYLIAQQQQQEELRKQLSDVSRANSGAPSGVQPIKQIEPLKPSPELSDYLFAQTLLNQYRASQTQDAQPSSAQPVADNITIANPPTEPAVSSQPLTDMMQKNDRSQLADIYSAGMNEIFGSRSVAPVSDALPPAPNKDLPSVNNPLEVNPLRIAYSKLPMALRDRAFVRKAGALRRVGIPPSTPPNSQAAGAS
jgi:hypothetical protein